MGRQSRCFNGLRFKPVKLLTRILIKAMYASMMTSFANWRRILPLLLTGSVLISHAVVSAAPETKAAPTTSANSTNRFEVTGMTCEVCVKNVTSKLKRVPGVVTASVTLSNNLAVVAIDTNKFSSKTLVKTMEDAGYPTKPKL